MLYLDLALRGGAIGMLILLTALLWRAPIGWEGRLSILAVAVAETAFLVISTALPLGLPGFVMANLVLFASLTPNAITWLIVTIFVDPPFRRWPWFVASSIVSLALYMEKATPELMPGSICAGLAVALYTALVGLALWSARDDLVECRCRARPFFAATIAGLGLVLTSVQVLGIAPDGSLLLALMKSTGTFGVTLAVALWMLNADMDRWPGEPDTEPRPAPQSDSTWDDPVLTARIETAMAGGAWQQEGLTIGDLAAQLAVPEHRLRRAINQGLGHRNFSSFINTQRIAAARARLSDPAACGTTILEIAYEVGFASLGPFNRAFRAETGQSPTEFRRERARMAGPADSEKTAPISANLH